MTNATVTNLKHLKLSVLHVTPRYDGTYSIRLHSIGMHCIFLLFFLRCLGLADIPSGREESELIHSDV